MKIIKTILKHGLIETFKNFSNINNAKHNADNYAGNTTNLIKPTNYELVFSDEFVGPLNTDEWRYGMPWGDFHPGSLHQYYDSDGTLSYVSHDGLVLELRNIPKTFRKRDLPDWRQTPTMPDEFTIPTGVGFVSTKKVWKYGWFEAIVKLPKGKSYWPAFWTSGLETWPPEIDIFEGYTHVGPNYEKNSFLNLFKKKPYYKIQPNVHYGDTNDGSKDDYGAYDVPVAKCNERFVQYVCHWEQDFIKIYYDGVLVFETKNPKILKWFNKENASQYVIFNHGLHQDYPNNPDESAMIIKSFKVYQIKK